MYPGYTHACISALSPDLTDHVSLGLYDTPLKNRLPGAVSILEILKLLLYRMGETCLHDLQSTIANAPVLDVRLETSSTVWNASHGDCLTMTPVKLCECKAFFVLRGTSFWSNSSRISRVALRIATGPRNETKITK